MLQFFKRQKTFFRYVVVGTLGTIVDLGSLYLMTHYSGIDPRKSGLFPVFVTLAFLLAVIHNYLLNRFWTFESHTHQVTAEFLRFFLVSLGGLVLTQVLMWFFVSLLGLWYMLAKALTSVIVLIWNFGLNKFWTFRQTHAPASDAEASTSTIATVG